MPFFTEFGKLSRSERPTPALLNDIGPRVVAVKRPNPARITVLSSLNGRYATLTRGSKSCTGVCRRPCGSPALLAATTLVQVSPVFLLGREHPLKDSRTPL